MPFYFWYVLWPVQAGNRISSLALKIKQIKFSSSENRPLPMEELPSGDHSRKVIDSSHIHWADALCPGWRAQDPKAWSPCSVTCQGKEKTQELRRWTPNQAGSRSEGTYRWLEEATPELSTKGCLNISQAKIEEKCWRKNKVQWSETANQELRHFQIPRPTGEARGTRASRICRNVYSPVNTGKCLSTPTPCPLPAPHSLVQDVPST